VANPETVLNQYYDAGRPPFFSLQTNYVEIVAGSPSLRLSTPRWTSFPLNGLRGIDSTELLFELSKEKIVTRIQPFAKRVRLFVERYFDFMADHVAANFDQLPSDPLIKPLDWIFSAWLPLTHAKVLVNPGAREKPAQTVEFDLIFWTGLELIGIQVEQKGTMVKSKREALERFKEEQPQFKLISIARDQFPDDKSKFPDEIFNENFLNFWSGIDLPKGPPVIPPQINGTFE
jgi:hypothetical protein